MGVNPAWQFYGGDWKKDPDLAKCDLATRAFWLELLDAMNQNAGYEISGTYQQLAKIARCETKHARHCVRVLHDTETADVTIEGKLITVICRRYQRQAMAKGEETAKKRRQRRQKSIDFDASSSSLSDPKTILNSNEIRSKTEGIFDRKTQNIRENGKFVPPLSPGPSSSSSSSSSKQEQTEGNKAAAPPDEKPASLNPTDSGIRFPETHAAINAASHYPGSPPKVSEKLMATVREKVDPEISDSHLAVVVHTVGRWRKDRSAYALIARVVRYLQSGAEQLPTLPPPGIRGRDSPPIDFLEARRRASNEEFALRMKEKLARDGQRKIQSA